MFVNTQQARFLFGPERCRLLDEGRKALSQSLMSRMHDFEEQDIPREEVDARSRSLWYPTHYFITKSRQADAHWDLIACCFVAQIFDLSTLGKDLSKHLD